MKTLAREWLWFIGSLPVAVVGTWLADAPDLISGFVFALVLTPVVYACVGIVRLTGWAIRTTRRSN